MNAFTLLKNDHEKVAGIIDKIEETIERALKTREELFAQLKTELDIHAKIEETILYPVLEKTDASRDITLDGANIVQQFIKAGLLDEVQIHLVPVLLGDGRRLFDRIGTEQIELESTRVIESPGVTRIRFRVVK